MTRQEMVAKLNSLKAGMMIEKAGKLYDVRYVSEPTGKLHKTVVVLLEEGRPEKEMVEGKYLAAGRMLEVTNIIRYEWFAQRQYMNWQEAHE
jgi:hypothetical protein